MSRALAMVVCGVIVIAHLSVALFLLGRHARDAAPAVPAPASQFVPEGAPSVQEPAASRVVRIVAFHPRGKCGAHRRLINLVPFT